MQRIGCMIIYWIPLLQVQHGLPCLLHGTQTRNSSKSSPDLFFDDETVVQFESGYCSVGTDRHKMVMKVTIFL